MASIGSDPNGAKRILFIGADCKRYTVRLGKVPVKTAQAVCGKIEALNAAKLMQQPPDDETARWVAGIDAKLHDRLAAVGLVARRADRGRMTLAKFIDGYMATRTDIRPRTRINLDQTRKDLLAYFGPDKALADIHEGDADDWRLWLARPKTNTDLVSVSKGGRGLGDNTVRRLCGRARQYFGAAVKRRLITSNPFGNMKDIRVRSNSSRMEFIDRETASKVLEVCPDSQWRLLFALSRYGGLRCRSEHLALTWGDVNWQRNRIRVVCVKTARHKTERWVPIFPELRPHLEAVWDEAEEGTEHVITRYRDANSNLRTQLLRIIGRAGVEAWPKLFQNLRSTRQTELAAQWPAHVVCDWLGNSVDVAREHYLQTTDSDFDRAAQNAAQSGAVQGSKEQQTKAVNVLFTADYGSLPNCTSEQVPPRGVEPRFSD